MLLLTEETGYEDVVVVTVVNADPITERVTSLVSPEHCLIGGRPLVKIGGL